jgi:hypothetical protein
MPDIFSIADWTFGTVGNTPRRQTARAGHSGFSERGAFRARANSEARAADPRRLQILITALPADHEA